MRIRELQKLTADRSWTTEWDLPRWGNALAGEVGEACNVIKKIDRDGETPELRLNLREELGDVFNYLILLCNHAGFDLENLCIDAFNKVQSRRGLDFRLEKMDDRTDSSIG